MKIGDWIRRERRPTWHIVESVVAEDAVTHCGRRMRNERNSLGGLVVYIPGTRMPLIPLCKDCDR